MKTLIAYAGKYGCTEKCAAALSVKLSGEVDLCNLKGAWDADLSQYDRVIVGGSVHMGRIQKEVRRFCSKNLERLKDKKIGLFICCMGEGDVAETELNSSFPQELLSNAVAKEYFGGEFILSKMNALDRFIVKKVSKTDKDISNILEDNIVRFSQLMNNA